MFLLAKKRARPTVTASAERDPSRIRAIGAELLERSAAHERGLLSAKFYADKLVDWAMRDEQFKTQLFRLVDVFPVLRTPGAVYDHIDQYLNAPGVKPPPGFSLGLRMGSLAKGAVTSTMSSQIGSMAKQFIAGHDAASALPKLREQWDRHVGLSVDLLGEACLSAPEADAYTQRYLDLLGTLGPAAAAWPADPLLERDAVGPVPRVNVSVKLSALTPRFNPLDPAGTIADLRPRVDALLNAARKANAFVNVDMESESYKDVTLAAFHELFATAEGVEVGIVLQAYLRSGEADVAALAEAVRRSGRSVTVRLVKGAYWDFETIYAEMMGWPSPVWPVKRATDACFERMARQLLDAAPRDGRAGLKLALGSHNVRSIASALAAAEERGLPRSAVELQMLYGMADPIKAAAVEIDCRVRNYVPVGEVIPGMAYLVRRLLENTSNESWLLGFSKNVDLDRLLADPAGDPPPAATPTADRHNLSPSDPKVGDGRSFRNEPLRDFSKEPARRAFAAAGAAASVPQVAIVSDVKLAHGALTRAATAFPAWRDTPVRDRAAVLTRAAGLMRARRDALSAVLVLEAGKPWVEADADVCEAIDFCEFNARAAVRLFDPHRLGKFVGELNETMHEPRGPAVVISPWNFPLAICCGMTVAALVTGNPAIVKPAEQTPGIAKLLVDLLHEAGAPAGVVQLLPGDGETIGAALVRDPRTALVAFTGSRDVGFDILRAAGDTQLTQPGVKRVIAEMGGKNAIIVDASADADEAVLGVRQSAFGYSGQKCSACSRVIVVDDGAGSFDAFAERLVAATAALVVGDPREAGTQVGPVIDGAAAAKITAAIERGKAEARCALAMPLPDGLAARTGRSYVGPHVFVDAPPGGFLATEEIFGPVLAVFRAASFETALEMANASPYKLTGGVYSRTPGNLALARRAFRVGNLYLNRNITGALVGRQPFGGFGHSGVGSKAGGADYLLQFVEPRVVTENTLRRGFAPADEPAVLAPANGAAGGV
jgi:RHH-type proline utilization regulon transcriptional repressor/proline dehydrogenase/delta 1-pyrroline-5-carboxylate dehydrogenase